jgi:hypothetical protein
MDGERGRRGGLRHNEHAGEREKGMEQGLFDLLVCLICLFLASICPYKNSSMRHRTEIQRDRETCTREEQARSWKTKKHREGGDGVCLCLCALCSRCVPDNWSLRCAASLHLSLSLSVSLARSLSCALPLARSFSLSLSRSLLSLCLSALSLSRALSLFSRSLSLCSLSLSCSLCLSLALSRPLSLFSFECTQGVTRFRV